MDLDPDFQALMQGPSAAQAAPGASARSSGAPPSSSFDPSAGGGTLQFGPLDTGIRTPQWLDRTLAGAGQGMEDLGRHAGNLVGLESGGDLAEAKKYDAPLMSTTAGKVGSFLGQTAAMAPIGIGAGAGLSRLGSMGARLAANPIASGAVQGAAQGTLLADPGNRLIGGAAGAITGAALPTLGAGIGKIAQGLSRTPAAQALIDAGVQLTPGQMNPTGIANRMEQAAEGTFGVGDLIQNARSNSMQQYSRAMVERSMAPGAKLTSTSGDFNDWIDEAAKSFDNAYNAGKGFPVGAKIMQVQGQDVPLKAVLQQVTQKPRIGLTPQDRASWGGQLTDQLQDTINAARQSGGMQSDDLLAFRSAIRDAIRGEPGDTNASRAAIGLLEDAQGKVTQALESQIPPDAARAVRDADQQYAKFAIVRDAAKQAKDAPGGPTPFQFSQAIAKATQPNQYASGGGLNRDLSKAARETLTSNVPPPGHAANGRLAIPAALGAGAAPIGLAHPLLGVPALAGALGTAGLALTSTGRRMAAGSTGWQQALNQGINNVTGSLSPTAQGLLGDYGRAALTRGLLGSRLEQNAQ